jgi:uncharacterized protein (DUF1778 family)
MKTESVEVRMQPEEKETFRLAANLAGIPVSAWIRERLRRAAIRELIDAGRQVPILQMRDREAGS